MADTGVRIVVEMACCGEVFDTIVETFGHECKPSSSDELFEGIWELEMQLRGEKASVAFAGAGVPLFVKDRNHKNAKTAQERLYAALDALTPGEAKAYGEFRARVLAEIAQMS